MVIVRIQNVDMLIEGDLPPDVREEIRAVMSYVVPNFKFTTAYKRAGYGKWDGTKTVALRDGKRLRAPAGLLSYLKEILNKRCIQYEVRDERPQTVYSSGYHLDGIVLRDYQEGIVKEALKRQRGVIKAATGSGKTLVMASIIAQASCFPAVFYVTSCDLLEQACDYFTKYLRLNGQPVEIGRIGDGHCDIRPITIATVQSCQRALEGEYTPFDEFSQDDKTEFSENQKKQIVDLVKNAQFVYSDEAQHVSCQTIQAILNNSHSARFRFGGSASPWRDDGLDILIEACFGRRLCDISASFLIKKGWLLRPKIIFNHFRQSLAMAANFNAHYSAYVVNNVVRNQWTAERAKFHVSEDRPVIILVKWVEHAEALAALIPGCEILTSSGDPQKTPRRRKELLNKMRAKELMCIIGTSLLDEGVDVPAAGAGIFAGGGKSSTRELQRVGRFIRPDPADPGKEFAYIEEFYDHTKWLMHHAKTRRKILEVEPEFEISDNKATLAL